MAEFTEISWTNATWNPIAGCSIASPGCKNCYAMRRVAPRLAANPATPHYAGTVERKKTGYVWTGRIGIAGERAFMKPLTWRKPRMIFVNSTSDLFHEDVPDHVIDRIFAIMALCPQHSFQVLTKRSARMREYVSRTYEQWHGNADNFADRFQDAMDWNMAWINDIDDMQWPLPNVWLGVSVEDQKRADERIPDLLATPAAVRFISAEPLLGPVDLTACPKDDALLGYAPDDNGDCHIIDWVIIGAESGSGARPMENIWAQSLVNQCRDAGVAAFVKQLSSFGPKAITDIDAFPSDLRVREFPRQMRRAA